MDLNLPKLFPTNVVWYSVGPPISVNEWSLFNAKWTIFNSILEKTSYISMMVSSLYYTNTLSGGVIIYIVTKIDRSLRENK